MQNNHGYYSKMAWVAPITFFLMGNCLKSDEEKLD